MENSIDALVRQFEAGSLTRRELIAALTAATVLGGMFPAGGAADESGPGTLTFDPTDGRHVMFARLANLYYEIDGSGKVKPKASPTIWDEDEGPLHEAWLFGTEGVFSSNPTSAKATARLREAQGKGGKHPKAESNYDGAYADWIRAVAVANRDFIGAADWDLAYHVMKKKLELVEIAGMRELADDFKDWLDKTDEIGKRDRAICRKKIDELVANHKRLEEVAALTSTWSEPERRNSHSY